MRFPEFRSAVLHGSWDHGGGCLVGARTTEELEKMEPWQGQSHCLRWGNTSWLGHGEIPCLHFSFCPRVFFQHLTLPALPGSQLTRTLRITRGKQERARQGGTRWCKPAHNVNRSNHIPWCSAFPPFSHSFSCQIIYVLPTVCKIICFSFEVYLELFRF